MNTYKYINLDYINDMASGDMGFIVEMINDYKEKMPQYITDLNKALAEANLEDIKFCAHKLSSSFMIMGARQLADSAARIVHCVREGSNTEIIPDEVQHINTLFVHVVSELNQELGRLKVKGEK